MHNYGYSHFECELAARLQWPCSFGGVRHCQHGGSWNHCDWAAQRLFRNLWVTSRRMCPCFIVYCINVEQGMIQDFSKSRAIKGPHFPEGLSTCSTSMQISVLSKVTFHQSFHVCPWLYNSERRNILLKIFCKLSLFQTHRVLQKSRENFHIYFIPVQ